jgi:hypothetical protein
MGCHLYPRISCIPQIRLPINRKGKRKGKEKKKRCTTNDARPSGE